MRDIVLKVFTNALEVMENQLLIALLYLDQCATYMRMLPQSNLEVMIYKLAARLIPRNFLGAKYAEY